MNSIKSYSLLALALFFSLAIFAQESERVYSMADKAPLFPGCETAAKQAQREACSKDSFMAFLAESLQIESGKKGILAFIVNKDGSIRDIKMEKSIDEDTDWLIIERVFEMANWTPGENDGEAVAVQMYFPLEFPINALPQKTEEEEEIFVVVEQMPTFPGCEDLESKQDIEQCAQSEMLQFIYKELQYPSEAKDTGIEGTVVVRFTVEKDGNLSNIKLLRDIGGGCGEEALRLVESMPNWNPGYQRGRPVRVNFNLPVKFQL
ncbi:MAG: energy transducer TonB [Bacteroidetes bacterium]|nr:energy transducer TonB [Bacteroidota bacterium]